MGLKSSKRKTATDADALRMYIRGRKRTLNVKGLPLEEALALAKISPNRVPARKRALGRPERRIAVVPAPEATTKECSRPNKKQPSPVGASRSIRVLRPKFPPKPAPTLPVATPVKKQTSAAEPKPKIRKTNAASQPGVETKTGKKGSGKRRTSLAYDGQPRFEGGMRIVQGGRFESRR